MSGNDEYTATLSRFCEGMADKVAALADDGEDIGCRVLAEGMVTAIREAIGQLLWCELECERVLRRG